MSKRHMGLNSSKLIAILLVAGLAPASFGTNALMGYAELHYHVANTAADLQRDLTKLDSSNGDLAMANPSPEVIAAAVAAERAVIVDVARLRTFEQASSVAGHLAADARLLVAGVAHERSMVGNGVPDEVAAQAGRNDVLYLGLRNKADQAVEEARALADANSRLAKAGVMGLGIIVLAAVAWLLWWDGRRRRRDDQARLLQANAARFEALVEHGSDVVVITDLDGVPSYVSSSVVKLLGREPAEWLSQEDPGLLHPDDVEAVAEALARIRLNGELDPVDIRFLHADGGWRILELSAVDMASTTDVGGIVWHCRDVTYRRSLEASLTKQALEDGLTGMPNKTLFDDRLTHAQVRSALTHRPIAVLLLDLDSFKMVNDSLGHGAGDEVLIETAARLSGFMRPGDTAARLGGDEFVVLVEDIAEPSLPGEVATRILDLIRQPMTIRGKEMRITASIGVAVSKAGTDSAEELVRDADVAMYVAKSRGSGRVVQFEAEMRSHAQDRLAMSADLSRALERHQLVVHFQPIVSMTTGEILGAEALLRWNHPERGVVPPLAFIPLAEQTGQIVAIGRWVLKQACQQAMRWHNDFPREPRLSVSVNVSGRQLLDTSLVPDVMSIVARTGLPPRCLTLEITESVLMADLDGVIDQLDELKLLGVMLAIDDFGTGYSSLAYLNHFPVDFLKIDKSFVDAAAAGTPGSETLVKAIVDLGRSLHLGTVAEGIEEARQESQMSALGCDAAQGYLYARPMPPDDFADLLAARRNGRPTERLPTAGVGVGLVK